jgi:hypothetical protein
MSDPLAAQTQELRVLLGLIGDIAVIAGICNPGTLREDVPIQHGSLHGEYLGRPMVDLLWCSTTWIL